MSDQWWFKSDIHFIIGYDDFRIQFHFIGLFVVGNFVDRDIKMEQIKHSLLQSDPQSERKIHILHDFDDIGKTQLAITYVKKHQKVYNAILMINDKNKNTFLQSFATFATYARIDDMQQSTVDFIKHGQKTAKKTDAILRWLTFERNCQWFIVFDNVDRDYRAKTEDSQIYDIVSFFSATDHGSIFIITRLSHLEELGSATKISKIDSQQILRIFINNSFLSQFISDSIIFWNSHSRHINGLIVE